jgi:hypothetical protein
VLTALLPALWILLAALWVLLAALWVFAALLSTAPLPKWGHTMDRQQGLDRKPPYGTEHGRSEDSGAVIGWKQTPPFAPLRSR